MKKYLGYFLMSLPVIATLVFSAIISPFAFLFVVIGTTLIAGCIELGAYLTLPEDK